MVSVRGAPVVEMMGVVIVAVTNDAVLVSVGAKVVEIGMKVVIAVTSEQRTGA